MASALTQSTFKGAAVSVAAPKAQRASAKMVVSASAQSRRAMIGFVAGAAATTLVADSASAYDFGAPKIGAQDSYYQVMDVENDFKYRSPFNGDDAKAPAARLKAASASVAALEPLVSKGYWTKCREGLRLQAGTIRFDMRQGNVAQAVQDDVLAKMSKFDFACRSKDGAAASAAFADLKSALAQFA
eukprot:CAMPEP_0182865174 /NCGR_PEP_ID=MMETSP0034_2-20130328/7551_1 /TAXON_ID=156128 /ORGANISM="Nephroselmis pyriformis, Strain CCMP717" /LENGTH=186 /DNA_ID=CAMNT_0024997461 /DNA_START=38 /DNA_END=598 /DNA_ORIENTATION=-